MTLSVQRCLKTLWFPCECKHIWSLYEIHSMNILSTFIIEKLYILARKNVCTEQYGSVKFTKLWLVCWDVFINSQFCVYSHVYLSWKQIHYSDVIMSAMASHNTGVSIVYLTVFSGKDQKHYQSFASLAFVRGIHRGPVRRKMFPFDDVIMDLWIFVQNYV